MNRSEVRDVKLSLIRRIVNHGCLCNQARHIGLNQFLRSYYSVIACVFFTVTQKVFGRLLKKQVIALAKILNQVAFIKKKLFEQKIPGL